MYNCNYCDLPFFDTEGRVFHEEHCSHNPHLKKGTPTEKYCPRCPFQTLSQETLVKHMKTCGSKDY